MATVLEEQEAMQQDNTLMDRPLKKIQHVQQANLCLSMSKEHFYAKIKLPTNFAGVENLSDLTICYNITYQNGMQNLAQRTSGNAAKNSGLYQKP